jgi:hypothetical protein
MGFLNLQLTLLVFEFPLRTSETFLSFMLVPSSNSSRPPAFSPWLLHAHYNIHCKIRTDNKRLLENSSFISQNSKSTFHIPSCYAQAMAAHTIFNTSLDPPTGWSIFLFSANPSSPTKKYGIFGPYVPARSLSLGNSSIFVWVDVHSVDRLKVVESQYFPWQPMLPYTHRYSAFSTAINTTEKITCNYRISSRCDPVWLLEYVSHRRSLSNAGN